MIFAGVRSKKKKEMNNMKYQLVWAFRANEKTKEYSVILSDLNTIYKYISDLKNSLGKQLTHYIITPFGDN